MIFLQFHFFFCERSLAFDSPFLCKICVFYFRFEHFWRWCRKRLTLSKVWCQRMMSSLSQHWAKRIKSNHCRAFVRLCAEWERSIKMQATVAKVSLIVSERREGCFACGYLIFEKCCAQRDIWAHKTKTEFRWVCFSLSVSDTHLWHWKIIQYGFNRVLLLLLLLLAFAVVPEIYVIYFFSSVKYLR